MRSRPPIARALLGLGALWAGGCAHYQARPISPAASLQAFEARRLDAPELARFLRTRAGIEAWPPARWDLQALTLVALYYSPDLDLARARWGVARAGVVAAGGRPEPAATAALGYNSSAVAGVTPWIPEGVLDIPLETAGKRGLRLAEARRLSEAARLDILSVAWQVRGRLRRALLNDFLAENGARLAAAERDLREQSAGILDRQLALGEVSPADVTTARIARDQSRLQASRAEQERVRARVALADALGVPAAALDAVALSFDGLDRLDVALPSKELRRRALVSRPDILSALGAYEASQAALRLEIARQYPDIHLGPGYQLDQTDSKWTLALGLTLPLLNRNKGPIAEAEARRTEAASRFLALQSGVVAEVDAAVAASRAALTQARTAEELMREVARRKTTAEAAYRLGEISRLELLGVQIELVVARQSRLDAVGEAQQAVGALEQALASPVPGEDWVVKGPGGNRSRESPNP